MKLLGITILAFAALLAAPALASAQEEYPVPTTRKEFVKEADRTCEGPYARVAKQLRRVGPLAEKKRYKASGAALIRAARIVLDVNGRLRELSRPPADEERIESWLDADRRASRLAVKAGRSIQRKKLGRANRRLDRVVKISSRGTKPVRGFGFKHCI